MLVLQPAEAHAVPVHAVVGPHMLAPHVGLAAGQHAAVLPEHEGGELVARTAAGLRADSVGVLQAAAHRRVVEAPRYVGGAQVAARHTGEGEHRAPYREVALGSSVEPRALGEPRRGVADVDRRVAVDRTHVAEACGSPTVEACGTQDAAHRAA